MLADALHSTLTLGNSITLGGLLGAALIIWFIVTVTIAESNSKRRKIRKERERTLNEITAYISESTFTADQAERFIAAMTKPNPDHEKLITGCFYIDKKSMLEREQTYRMMAANVAEGQINAEEAIGIVRAMAAGDRTAPPSQATPSQATAEPNPAPQQA